MKLNVLVVEDHASSGETLLELLEEFDCKGQLVKTAEEAMQVLTESDIDTVLTDLNLPGEDGLWLVDQLVKDNDGIPIILITGNATIDTAVDAIKRGAMDYLTKPIDVNRFEAILTSARRRRQQALEQETRERDEGNAFAGMIGQSQKMNELREMISRVAPTPASVLILGESGTGKELVANALVSISQRNRAPYIKLNSAALPKDTLESELFGHVKGSFTGAIKDRKGRFEMANGGTLFLDEIGDMPMETQVKLLRVLQEGEFERVGGSETIKVDVRIVAATNRNLMKAVKEGTFREDLYYRLNVIQVHVPPLRDRKADIPLLAQEFLTHFSGSTTKRCDDSAMKIMQMYDWPGNIRELRNIMERLSIIVPGDVIKETDLPMEIRQMGQTDSGESMAIEGKMDDIERNAIITTLKKTGGVKSEAAKQLGIGLKTLYRKLEKYEEEGVDLSFLKQ